MITLFCVRPRGFNVGNDTIFIGLRHLLREAFDGLVNIVQVPSKPKMRNYKKGRRPGWKKAIVQLREGDSIEIFEGAQL